MKTITVNPFKDYSLTAMPYKNEFVMPTKDVALGFGVCKNTLLKTYQRNTDEIIEGRHFVKGVDISSTPLGKGVQPHAVYWTKSGIVRLGFFIKSERAKAFRDWAEDFIIDAHLKKQAKQATLFNAEAAPAPKPLNPSGRNINRLTPARLIAIMQDVIRIEDAALRQSISEKLLNPTK